MPISSSQNNPATSEVDGSVVPESSSGGSPYANNHPSSAIDDQKKPKRIMRNGQIILHLCHSINGWYRLSSQHAFLITVFFFSFFVFLPFFQRPYAFGFSFQIGLFLHSESWLCNYKTFSIQLLIILLKTEPNKQRMKSKYGTVSGLEATNSNNIGWIFFQLVPVAASQQVTLKDLHESSWFVCFFFFLGFHLMTVVKSTISIHTRSSNLKIITSLVNSEIILYELSVCHSCHPQFLKSIQFKILKNEKKKTENDEEMLFWFNKFSIFSLCDQFRILLF